MFYIGKSYRDMDMEEWYLATDRLHNALKLKEVPDHSTLNQAYERFWMSLLKQ